ncbi:hypothetical protein DRZ77_01370 [Candidatus Woesearchaeota archaeon]|nr:DUF4234 domain-containing protein [Candidatus Woesearchaeota archaeon]RLE40749.1 MAG: hypothetical protein DRZ77_01370 [Candidatus Woesearchaeota archaeon]
MVKYRNPALVIVFTLITFGIYGLYWLVSTAKELHELKVKDAPNPMLVVWAFLISIFGSIANAFGVFVGVILVFIAVGLMISYYWKYSKAIEQLSKGKYSFVLLFIFFIAFAFVSIALSQVTLNSYAKKK